MRDAKITMFYSTKVHEHAGRGVAKSHWFATFLTKLQWISINNKQKMCGKFFLLYFVYKKLLILNFLIRIDAFDIENIS